MFRRQILLTSIVSRSMGLWLVQGPNGSLTRAVHPHGASVEQWSVTSSSRSRRVSLDIICRFRTRFQSRTRSNIPRVFETFRPAKYSRRIETFENFDRPPSTLPNFRSLSIFSPIFIYVLVLRSLFLTWLYCVYFSLDRPLPFIREFVYRISH